MIDVSTGLKNNIFHNVFVNDYMLLHGSNAQLVLVYGHTLSSETKVTTRTDYPRGVKCKGGGNCLLLADSSGTVYYINSVPYEGQAD